MTDINTAALEKAQARIRDLEGALWSAYGVLRHHGLFGPTFQQIRVVLGITELSAAKDPA